jgi:hypothetical protein
VAGLSRHSTHTRLLHALPGAAILGPLGQLEDGPVAAAVSEALGISVPDGHLSTDAVAAADRPATVSATLEVPGLASGFALASLLPTGV